MSRMFTFDPAQYSAAFAAQGYVYIPEGLTPEFHKILSRQVDEYLAGQLLDEWALGQKQQALYEFPTSDYLQQFQQAVGQVCGRNPDRLVLSERHIKAYDQNAAPYPLAHKDRFASEVSVGFSVNVPQGSTLILYPNDDVEPNPFNTSAELRSSLGHDQLPEQTLRQARRIEIQDSPRDVVMFRGNAIWHMRHNPAGTTMVYLKLNAMNCDPLGEDPSTDRLAAETQLHLQLDDEQLSRLVPQIGRRVNHIQKRYNRDWREVLGVVLWRDHHVTIEEPEYNALRAMDGYRTVREVLASAEGARFNHIRSLAARGLVDLMIVSENPAAAHHAPQASRTKVSKLARV